MDGRFLAKARPYLQVLSIFTLAPPPGCYGWRNSRRWIVAYTCYVLATLLIGIYVNCMNIVALNQETDFYELEDFTKALGAAQKGFQALFLITLHLNMALQYRRFAHIYVDIYDLEMDVEHTTRCHEPNGFSLRLRLFLSCGLWFCTLMPAYSRFTYPALTFLTRFDKALTAWIMIILQTICVEYCVFVNLMHEFLVRLHCTLGQLQDELADCRTPEMLHALCMALRENQQLLGRTWQLVGELDKYFTPPMLCLFLNNGMAILHVVNWAYIQALNPNDCCRYWRFGNMIILILNVLVPCWLAQGCADTYNKFLRTIHNIRGRRSLPNFSMLTMGIREYSLQLQHLRLRFTCGGFFDINLKYFGGMILTIVSYTIILIQFKLQSLVRASNRSNLTVPSDKST
ncbi:uncharacterized protein Dwil_GK11756 [Drosophila willistoni]|uniref:Gustatory receptor n=1 Tax=Drosophila willistoni TaxID=7260 RepID=B4NAP9_DROWI|nr:putative gustatory receptor 98b [Drosophila willistoni]EDW80863.1 uncharacterized protein Dwil_GK11756 [Drosophila willistoni]